MLFGAQYGGDAVCCAVELGLGLYSRGVLDPPTVASARFASLFGSWNAAKMPIRLSFERVVLEKLIFKQIFRIFLTLGSCDHWTGQCGTRLMLCFGMSGSRKWA